MIKVLKFMLFAFVLNCPFYMFAWKGMPTPPLHVEGNKLKDPTGKDVLLHGWMQPTSNWFNGEGKWYSDPSNWKDASNVAGLLNYMKEVATLMSDTTPKYSQTHGWYTSFVRMNTDAVGGWTNEAGLIDTTQFNAWISNFIVPYSKFLSTRGLYLVLSATGPMTVPNENLTQKCQQRFLTFWKRVANAPGVKNADNIMFELMNEPVTIESSFGAGDWGNHQAKYYKAFTNWLQPIIDSVRNTGANNIIWVPTLEWQGTPFQWVQYPFSGTNIGVAAHYYPAYGGVFDNATAIQNLWNNQYKPAADRWPMIITELFWTPYPSDPMNLVNGKSSVFGNAIKKAMDTQGNVSYIVGFIGDLLESLNVSRPKSCTLSPREGAQSYFQWQPSYASQGPDDGTPTLGYASALNNNPKQIQVVLTHPIKDSVNFDGFTVNVDNQAASIDNVVMGDTINTLIINLHDSIMNNSHIAISYSNGNVVSVFDKVLGNFTNSLVDNQLKGSSPEMVTLSTDEDGTLLLAKFNKKMQLPTDLSAFSLSATFNGTRSVLMNQVSFFNNDSTLLAFTLGDTIYADYSLSLSYSGSDFGSSDSGLLNTFPDRAVTNNSIGLPVQITSGKIGTDGFTVSLECSKPIAIAIGQAGRFIIKVNKKTVSFKDFFVLNKTLRFTLLNSVHYADSVKITYNPGTVTATDMGPLESVSSFVLENPLTAPTWTKIPGRVQAEKYALQSGVQTENTQDAGGGLDVGWIDNGDWMEYAIDNSSSATSYNIAFRVATPSTATGFDYYLDNVKKGSVVVPNTGNYQVWQSVEKTITIASGQHYLKIVVTKGGFNLNYIDAIGLSTGIDEVNSSKMIIYPNPVSTEMVICSTDFQYNEIEIIDMSGKAVVRKSVAYEPELHIPVTLLNGMYLVRISSERESQVQRIIVVNK